MFAMEILWSNSDDRNHNSQGLDIREDINMSSQLIDKYGRHITYLRLSVTDRCDLRCTYCMAEKMTFLPRKDLLTLEEMGLLCDIFIAPRCS